MSIMKTDVQIQKDVLTELQWDTRVAATDVGVEVDEAVVTLTGTVESYAMEVAAREAAHRVAGVLDVADNIRVIIPGFGRRTDTEVAEAVRRALTWDVFVPEERIRSTVSDGWVTLEGGVDSLQQQMDAADAIRKLPGVRGVTNQIHVIGPRIEPQVVRKSIEEALERRAARDAQRISVQVDDGTVTLSGAVHDWAEETAVLDAVAHAPGVHSVKNQLRRGVAAP